jgi:quercetin dioxygenase-like cupin family protein
MSKIEKKKLNEKIDVNNFEKLKVETVTIRGFTFRRVTAQPGWQWSKHLRFIQKTDSCQTDHIFYLVSGRLRVRMDDGEEEEFGPGDLGSILPGHDGWTVGDTPAVWIEIPHQIT